MTRNICCALALMALAPAARAAKTVAHELQDVFARTAAGAKPAVVNISAIHEELLRVAPMSPFFFGVPEDFEGGQVYKHRSEGVGSGFIIDAQGHVVTNDHVVRDAVEIKVTLTRPDGKEETLPGVVIGRDPNLDLAVVQIKAKRSFPFLRFADSDKARVGDWTIAIGSPFSLQQTVTVGVLSAVRQTLYIEGRPYLNLLQTDAAINRGNSGGPLIDLDGEVVGVNTAIYSPSGASAGVGFAIPANEVRLALEYLLSGRQRRSGWVGVEVAPVDEVIARRFGLREAGGVIVNSVVPGSPAERAGLRRGDIIVRMDGRDVASPQELVARVARLAPDARLPMEVHRGGRRISLEVRLGERPEETASARPRGRRPGARSGPAPFSWQGAHFEESSEGVRVARVDPGSPLAGTLMDGDVVRGLDDSEVGSLDDLRQASKRADLKRGVVLDILRRGRPMYLSLRLS